MPLNIAKLRYIDAPQFVDVGNIVASYQLTQGATAAGTITPWNTGSGAALGLAGTFQNSPTITYTPLTGSKFIQGLPTPLPAPSVFGAIQNGVPADLILPSAAISINGLKNQQTTLDGITPADPAFDQVRTLVRKIQLSGGVRTTSSRARTRSRQQSLRFVARILLRKPWQILSSCVACSS